MEVDYRHYQYNIAVPPFDEGHPISKSLIPYWKNFWKNLLENLNSKEGFREDELHWQKVIAYITHSDKFVGLYFISNYKANNFTSSKYAQRYLPCMVAKSLKHITEGHINTLQYFSVDPNYSYRKTGINFASVLSDISTLHHHELGACKTLAVIRKSIGMHNMARKVGFREYCTAKKHGVDVSVMHNTQPNRHPKKIITKISDHLWDNRVFSKKEEWENV